MDATQEMLTLGVCNILSSLVRGLPSCGAFTRSAVSQASGVRSPAAGVYSGERGSSAAQSVLRADSLTCDRSRSRDAAGPRVPHGVLLLYTEGLPLVRPHLRRRVHGECPRPPQVGGGRLGLMRWSSLDRPLLRAPRVALVSLGGSGGGGDVRVLCGGRRGRCRGRRRAMLGGRPAAGGVSRPARASPRLVAAGPPPPFARVRERGSRGECRPVGTGRVASAPAGVVRLRLPRVTRLHRPEGE